MKFFFVLFIFINFIFACNEGNKEKLHAQYYNSKKGEYRLVKYYQSEKQQTELNAISLGGKVEYFKVSFKKDSNLPIKVERYLNQRLESYKLYFYKKNENQKKIVKSISFYSNRRKLLKEKIYLKLNKILVFQYKYTVSQIVIDSFANDILKKISNKDDKKYILNNYLKDDDKKVYILNKNLTGKEKKKIYRILKSAKNHKKKKYILVKERYVNEIPDGRWIVYNESGKEIREEFYKNGQIQRHWLYFYDPKGKRIREEKYDKAGKLTYKYSYK